MPASFCKPSLSHQILSLLKDHGPVSIDLLHRMTDPPSPKANLRQSLSILRKKGFINAVSIDTQTTFYHLSPFKNDKEIVAHILDIDTSSLNQSLLRKQDWIHNQWSEYWIHVISRIFPEAKIVREKSIAANETAKRILKLRQRDFDLMPDFLVSFPKNQNQEAVHIAFEIERTRKSNQRILRKLKKYLNGTILDGLIYICDSCSLSETIRMLYETKLIEQAHRIKHYANNFFLFSDSFVGGGPKLDRLLNAKTEQVEIEKWIMLLRKTKWTLRRDAEFVEY